MGNYWRSHVLERLHLRLLFRQQQRDVFRVPDPGRHPVGHFYRQCTRLLCRNCANEIESSGDADVADVLGDWVDHSRRYHLSLPIQE